VTKQIYREGDIVNVHFLPDSMSHFSKGIAIVVEVDRNEYQKDTEYEWNYGLNFLDNDFYIHDNRSYWYNHLNLEIVEQGLVHRYKAKEDEE